VCFAALPLLPISPSSFLFISAEFSVVVDFLCVIPCLVLGRLPKQATITRHLLTIGAGLTFPTPFSFLALPYPSEIVCPTFSATDGRRFL
jgi:hypothetical protein